MEYRDGAMVEDDDERPLDRAAGRRAAGEGVRPAG
jgi:hypothetical protein